VELKDGIELPAPVLRRHGDELLRLLAEQRIVPETDLPDKLPSPLNASQRGEVKKLKARVREHAAELAVAPEVLLYSKDYELLLREASGEDIQHPIHWAGWRKDAALAPLREMLAASKE
jgi:ribonuclease D